MSALTERHEAVFAQFFDMRAQLISAAKLKDILSTRLEQVELIINDKGMSEKTHWLAKGEYQALRAIKMDIDKLVGGR